jgi:hypothetical protein
VRHRFTLVVCIFARASSSSSLFSRNGAGSGPSATSKLPLPLLR